MSLYRRPLYQKVRERLIEPRSFVQVLAGPRQVGKTTLAHQVKEFLPFPSHYASADSSCLRDSAWIEQQWEIGRKLAEQNNNDFGVLLVLDEIQKIPFWPDTVKKLWDEDTLNQLNLKIMILGSSSVLIQTGLGESLAGRFEIIPISHWSFEECREAFDLNLEEYIYFGGYPAAAILIKDEERWARYIVDSLIETSISRDIMLMTSIHKPALLRRVFELGCLATGRVVSYQKMLGQLQDAGNAATLAHYLELLSGSGLLTGIQKISMNPVRQKASSPKLQVLNTALATAQSPLFFESAKQNREVWQKLTECAIGAHLLNATFGTKIGIYYWKDNNRSVDFILRKDDDLIVIEINGTKKGKNNQGIDVFKQKYKPRHTFFVGGEGMAVEEFLLTPLRDLL